MEPVRRRLGGVLRIVAHLIRRIKAMFANVGRLFAASLAVACHLLAPHYLCAPRAWRGVLRISSGQLYLAWHRTYLALIAHCSFCDTA